VRRRVPVRSTVLLGLPPRGGNRLFRKGRGPADMRFRGRTVYEDMRRMQAVVRDTGLDSTVLRPGGLFHTDTVSDYRVGTARLPGRYTQRVGLACDLVRQA
ncbi:hypothetical protein ADK57_18260, partial [Streptomyces sp. MMG1533]